MDHIKWYTCGLASRQVSVPALHYLMKLDGILMEVDGVYNAIICSSLNPETGVAKHSEVILTK